MHDGLVRKGHGNLAFGRGAHRNTVHHRLPGQIKVVGILTAIERGGGNVVAVGRERDIRKCDMLEPYPLEAIAAVAVVVGNRPVAVNAFQHLVAVLVSSATERSFCVKMAEIQINGSGAIIRPSGETDGLWRRIFVAENELVAAVAQRWRKRVNDLQGARTEIARGSVLHPGRYGLANLGTGKRVRKLLPDGVVQRDCEWPGTRTARIGGHDLPGDERLTGRIKGNLHTIVAQKGALCQQRHAQSPQEKQRKKPR